MLGRSFFSQKYARPLFLETGPQAIIYNLEIEARVWNIWGWTNRKLTRDERRPHWPVWLTIKDLLTQNRSNSIRSAKKPKFECIVSVASFKLMILDPCATPLGGQWFWENIICCNIWCRSDPGECKQLLYSQGGCCCTFCNKRFLSGEMGGVCKLCRCAALCHKSSPCSCTSAYLLQIIIIFFAISFDIFSQSLTIIK